jgi:hypothetical protein
MLANFECVYSLRTYLQEKKYTSNQSEFVGVFESRKREHFFRDFLESLGVFNSFVSIDKVETVSLRYPLKVLVSSPWGVVTDYVSFGSYRDVQWARWGIPSSYRHVDIKQTRSFSKLMEKNFSLIQTMIPKIESKNFISLFTDAQSLGDKKSWNIKKWKVIVQDILLRTKLKIVVVTDSQRDFEILKGSDQSGRVIRYDYSDPKLTQTISPFAALVLNSKGVLSLDSGSAHMAGLLKTPCISLWGPTSPSHFGHMNNLNLRTSTCPPCNFSFRNKLCQKNVCMDEIDSSLVSELVIKMLKGDFYPHAKV